MAAEIVVEEVGTYLKRVRIHEGTEVPEMVEILGHQDKGVLVEDVRFDNMRSLIGWEELPEWEPVKR